MWIPTKNQFVHGTGGAVAAVLLHNRECSPQGIGFECHDNSGATASGDIGNKRQIPAQALFVDYEKWGGKFRPKCSVIETDIYNPALPGSRFGVDAHELADGVPDGMVKVYAGV